MKIFFPKDEKIRTLWTDSNYTKSNSFFEFIESEIKSNLANTHATGTMLTYKSQISKLRKFREKLSFNEIDLHFLEAFRNYMIKKGNDISTMDKTFRFVRTVYNKAIDKGIAEKQKYPFRFFSLA